MGISPGRAGIWPMNGNLAPSKIWLASGINNGWVAALSSSFDPRKILSKPFEASRPRFAASEDLKSVNIGNGSFEDPDRFTAMLGGWAVKFWACTNVEPNGSLLSVGAAFDCFWPGSGNWPSFRPGTGGLDLSSYKKKNVSTQVWPTCVQLGSCSQKDECFCRAVLQNGQAQKRINIDSSSPLNRCNISLHLEWGMCVPGGGGGGGPSGWRLLK